MSNNDLKEIWSKQESINPIDVVEIINKSKRYKKRHQTKFFLMNIAVVITSTIICLIWYYFQPEMISTKIGIILIIVAMFTYVVSSNKAMLILKEKNTDLTSKSFLDNLIKFKEKQSFLQKTMLAIYFVLLSIGIALYMFEYTIRMTALWSFITYAITFIWIGFNWFYLRPKTIKKQQAEINTLIDKLNSINNQFLIREF